jgi:hypothetical protein
LLPPQTSVVSYTGGRSESGLFHGDGSAVFISGQEYAGQWQLGHMHGAGSLAFADGASWQGAMQQGSITGAGVSATPPHLPHAAKLLLPDAPYPVPARAEGLEPALGAEQ